jgi:hypothetical protein
MFEFRSQSFESKSQTFEEFVEKKYTLCPKKGQIRLKWVKFALIYQNWGKLTQFWQRGYYNLYRY